MCKKQKCYHCAKETQVTERIIKLTPIHASVIYQILWNLEIYKIYRMRLHLGKIQISMFYSSIKISNKYVNKYKKQIKSMQIGSCLILMKKQTLKQGKHVNSLPRINQCQCICLFRCTLHHVPYCREVDSLLTMTSRKQQLHNQSRQSYATIANKGEKVVSTCVKKVIYSLHYTLIRMKM